MTATPTKNGAVSEAAAEETAREPRGDISRVHHDIISGLVNVVTEAGHQGVMYVHDWIAATDRGTRRDPKANSLEAPSELMNARICLELAVEYLRRLDDELFRQSSMTERPEPLPF